MHAYLAWDGEKQLVLFTEDEFEPLEVVGLGGVCEGEKAGWRRVVTGEATESALDYSKSGGPETETQRSDEKGWTTLKDGRRVFLPGKSRGGGGAGGAARKFDWDEAGVFLHQNESVNPKLTDTESSALKEYKEEAYYGINGRLRTQKESARTTGFHDRLDSAIDKSGIDEPIVVYRGVDKDLRFSGEYFKDWGYASTSLSKDIAEDFTGWTGSVYEILLPKGSHALNLEHWGDERERELLLPRGSQFKRVGQYKLELVS